MIDYGFAQSELGNGDGWINEANIRKVLQGIKDVGGSRVRMGVQAGAVVDLDRAVNLCVEYGIKPLLCLIGNPSFGYDGSVASFGKMCKTVALRYGPSGTNQVSEYEIMNEANNNLNEPRSADPSNYAQYLIAGSKAIKSVHSSATVIAAGVTPCNTDWFIIGSETNPVDWYKGIIAAGAGPYMDAWGFHVYVNESPTANTQALSYLTQVRALMVAQGYGALKAWITEVGVGFPAPNVSSLVVVRDWMKILIETIESYSWCGPFFIYQYRNATNNNNDPNSVYGVVNNDYSLRSPYYEYVLTVHGMGTADSTPPARVTGVTVGDVGSTTATFTWNPSTDNVAVFGYRIYLNGVKVLDTAATSGTTTGLIPGTPYTVTVTAIDAAGNESTPSAAIPPFTTNVPSSGGLQAFYQYTFTGTGSTLPTTFVQLGLGFTVASGVALPNPPTVDDEYVTVAPYTLDQQSPDHAAEIVQSTASTSPDAFALTLLRARPDGSQWVGCGISGGGQADACKILTYSGGVMTLQDACNAPPLQPGERNFASAEGGVYTITRLTPDGASKVLLSWTDLNGAYPGAANLRTGFGWHHKRVGGVNYPPPGITGQWKSSDLTGAHPVAGSTDLWMLALVDDADWPELIATGSWQSFI